MVHNFETLKNSFRLNYLVISNQKNAESNVVHLKTGRRNNLSTQLRQLKVLHNSSTVVQYPVAYLLLK